MWHPDYRNNVISMSLERGMELPPHLLEEAEGEEEEGPEEEDEEEEEEEEEDDEEVVGEEDHVDGDGSDQGSGATLRQVLYGNRRGGSNVNFSTTAREEEEEEEEEVGEEDHVDGDGADQGSGATLRQVLYGNRSGGSNVNFSTTARAPREVVNIDTQASEDDVIVVGARESNNQGRDINDVKVGGSVKGDNNGEHKGKLNRDEIDGLGCPICLDAWSSGGDHHVCCLPCGHIYGLSCIKKWLSRPYSNKCPQCKKKCGMKGIRLLYASQIVSVDGELQKRVQSLEDKCAKIEKENADWSKKEEDWKKREAHLRKKVQRLKERTRGLEGLLDDMKRRVSGSSPTCFNHQGQSTLDLDAHAKFHMRGCLSQFKMKKECQVEGARLFDIDYASHIFVIARRLSGMMGQQVLTKVSLSSDHEKEDIRLPDNIRVVKDLKISPHARLVLMASLGKKLSVLSTESNNTILTYELPAAAWSCSWDVSSSYYVYAGLQNGTVLQFDTRHTRGYVQSLTGLTCNPVHTLHSLSPDSSVSSGISSVLSASSPGLCQWNFGADGDRPYLIPESDQQGVCISLAYCQSSNDIVASYRPKIKTSGDMEITQPTLASLGQVAWGSHVLYKKMDCAYQKFGATSAHVSDIRLPKSTIIDGVYQSPVFASGDESTHELVLHELPSLMAIEHLKPQKPPIRDIKFACLLSSGLLGCLTEDSLDLFTAKLL